MRKRPQPAASHVHNAPLPAEAIQIGVRLRHARMTRRLTLRQLADKAECSERMVSKVENGRALPLLTTLHRICRVLDLTVGQLFGKANDPPGVLTRAGERAVLDMHPLRPDSGIKLEQLIPFDPTTLLEGSIHLIAPGSGLDFIFHQGDEIAYVIEGAIELMVGEVTYTVNEGDSAHFRSELPHGYRNLGPTPARVIVINTPPTLQVINEPSGGTARHTTLNKSRQLSLKATAVQVSRPASFREPDLAAGVYVVLAMVARFAMASCALLNSGKMRNYQPVMEG